MKTKYSSPFTLTLLLGSALFFTSCTKEAPVSPKEVKNDNEFRIQAQPDVSNSEYITVKASLIICGSYKPTGSTILTIVVGGWDVDKPAKYITLSSYRLYPEFYPASDLVTSSTGDEKRTVQSFNVPGGATYAFRISFWDYDQARGVYGWLPPNMKFNQTYNVIIPGTSKTVFVCVT